MKTNTRIVALVLLLLVICAALCFPGCGKEEVTYTVTFDLNGGIPAPTFVTSVTVKEGETVTLTKPIRVGYVFDGWYSTSPLHPGIFEAGTPVTENLTLVATWRDQKTDRRISCMVTLELDGGALPDGIEPTFRVPVGGRYELPEPTKTGYVFDGWYTASGGKVTPLYGYTKDITLYAHWIET